MRQACHSRGLSFHPLHHGTVREPTRISETESTGTSPIAAHTSPWQPSLKEASGASVFCYVSEGSLPRGPEPRQFVALASSHDLIGPPEFRAGGREEGL